MSIENTDTNIIRKKFEDELEYIEAKLKSISAKVLTTDFKADNNNTEKPKELLSDNLQPTVADGIKQITAESCDPINYECSVNSEKIDGPTTIPAVPTGPMIDFTEYLRGPLCNTTVDKEAVKEDFVNASMLIAQAKKMAKETDLYLKNLNDVILPRCRSADVTSDLIKKRNNVDVKNSKPLRSYIIKQNQKNNEPKNGLQLSMKPISAFLDKREHVEQNNTRPKSKNNIINLGVVTSNITSSKDTKSSSKEDTANNVAVVSCTAKKSDDQEKHNHKIKNLCIQRIPNISLKPDLVTQKLTKVQIKPEKKQNLKNSNSNTAYREFTFDFEPETCTCHLSSQSRPTRDETTACEEIQCILCTILENDLSNDVLSNQLDNILQYLQKKLDGTTHSEETSLKDLDRLIKEHATTGLTNSVIQQRLLEIAEHFFENNIQDDAFDQISEEIEKGSNLVLDRLNKIKNSLLARNPSTELPEVQSCTQNNSNNVNQCYNNPNHHNNYTENIFKKNNYVSVREFLQRGSNDLPASKMGQLPNRSELTTNVYNMTNINQDSDILNKKHEIEPEHFLRQKTTHFQHLDSSSSPIKLSTSSSTSLSVIYGKNDCSDNSKTNSIYEDDWEDDDSSHSEAIAGLNSNDLTSNNVNDKALIKKKNEHEGYENKIKHLSRANSKNDNYENNEIEDSFSGASCINNLFSH
ncbi:homeobox protein 4-like isoform X1 [Adelges cooleyi]|uniref:homeobox protein 4-like isoform X1 n=1 Tax=Adelges cooleyi TaxID=133065 RepID=UPI00217F644E|nr:homeobox protein 4-like isoform X1 [Adelges cooleyi]